MKLLRLEDGFGIVAIERQELESLISVASFSRRTYGFDQKFSREVRREFFMSADIAIQNLSQQLAAFKGEIRLDKKDIKPLGELLLQIGLENSKITPPGGMPGEKKKKLSDDIFKIHDEVFPPPQ